MSDDGFSDSFDESLMEIRIKTLMGTSFDVKVSSSDTVIDIKKKIFRVEGIPIYNQNLIFRSQELKDSIRLCDTGIQNKSTITLVTNMKGGPINTRRLSLNCEHHMVLKELKSLLENSRDELTPGSKVSVLVFKEGDIINLLRVIENEDGSYSPYNENPISPPTKPLKKDAHSGVFQRLVEHTQMCTKIENLRKKMADASSRRHHKGSKEEPKRKKLLDERLFGEAPVSDPKSPSKRDEDMDFKFLEECASELLDHVDLTVFEKNLDEENQSGTEEEVALKDKHRVKPRTLQPIRPKTLQPLIIKNPSPATVNSLYKERKGSYSHTKQNYTWMQRKKESRLFDGANSRERGGAAATFRSATTSQLEGSRLESSKSTSSVSGASLLSPLEMEGSAMDDIGAKFAEQLHLLDEDDQSVYGEGGFSMSTRNRLHLTRLVLSEGAERPKSSPDSMELEELPPDLWEIHEPASDRLKHSATCKVGLLKHRQGLEYNYDSLENHPSTSKIKSEISGGGGGNYSKASTTEYGVCSGANYFVPQFMSAPSAIPPQYAPKQPNYCDLYFKNDLNRSPLYSRRNSKKESEECPTDAPEPEDSAPPTFLTDCSSIQRLQNDLSSTTLAGTQSAAGVSSSNYSGTSSPSIQNSGTNGGTTTNSKSNNSSAELEEIITSIVNKSKELERDVGGGKSDSLRVDNEVFRSDGQYLGHELYGYGLYDLGLSTSDILERVNKIQEEATPLPPVITKKKSRCSECNKRLNITNIYNCRCGRIFCSQHRYSEVHRCTYDYKTEGRKILEHQNPLVTAEKIKRF